MSVVAVTARFLKPSHRTAVRLNLVVVHETTGLTRPLYSLTRATLENVNVASRAALDLLREEEGFYHYDDISQRREDDVPNPYRRRLIISREYCANGERWKRLLLDTFDRRAAVGSSSPSSSNRSIECTTVECTLTLYRETTVTVVALRRLAKTGRIVTTNYVREDVPLNLQTSRRRAREEQENTSSSSSFNQSSTFKNVEILATNEFAKHTSCDNGSHDLPPEDEHANACIACLDCIWVDTLVETTYFDDYNVVATFSKLPNDRRREVLEVPRFFFYRETWYDFSHSRGCAISRNARVTSAPSNGNVATGDYCPWHAWVDVHLTWLKKYILDEWSTSFGSGSTRPIASPLTLPTREGIWRDVRRHGFFTCGLYEVAFVEIVDDFDECDDYRRALLLFERDDFALLPLPAFAGDDSFDDYDDFGRFANIETEWIPRRFAYIDVSSITTCNDARYSNLSVFFGNGTTTRPYELVRRSPSARFFGTSGIRVRSAPTDRPFRAKISARSDSSRDSIVLRNISSNLEYMCRWRT